MKIKTTILYKNTYEYNTDNNIIEIINFKYIGERDLVIIENFLDTYPPLFKPRKLFLEFVLNKLINKPEFIDSSIKIQNILIQNI